MKIAICDDDKSICGLFQKKLKSVYPQAVIHCCYDGGGLLHMVQEPDILLLDIQMDGMDGIALAGKLRSRGWRTILIFITAYADYVFDAFDVGAFHYLVKPVSDERFYEVLQRAVMELENNRAAQKVSDTAAEGRKRQITVRSGGVHINIKVADIVYAEVFNRKVVIHTTTESIEYYGKLTTLQDELGADFYRPHRAYLVHLKYVTKYDSSVIFLTEGQALMAKQNYAGFVRAYMAYMKRECGRRDC